MNDAANYLILVSEFAESTVLTIAHRLRTVIDYDRVSVLTFIRPHKTKKGYKQVMVLEQGEIVEFARYGQQVSRNDKKTNFNCVFRPATLLKDSTSKFYLLCKATGKEEFATLKKLAGV